MHDSLSRKEEQNKVLKANHVSSVALGHRTEDSEMAWLAVDIILYIGLSVLVAWIVRKALTSGTLSHFPGPPALPFLGNVLQFDLKKPRLTLLAWSKRYGRAYRVRSTVGDLLVVSGLDEAYEVLIRNGKVFSGRPTSFRSDYVTRGNSLLFKPPDAKWKSLRKLSHRYLKQFGTGMSHLEGILVEASKYMLDEFQSKKGTPIDTMETLKSAALSSITVLLMGKALTPEHALHKMLLKYERDLIYYLGDTTLPLVMLDMYPFMFHLPLRDYKGLKEFVKFQDMCWQRIKEMQTDIKEDSLTKLLLENVTHKMAGDDAGLTEAEAGMTCLTLISAGVITTSLQCTFF